ncbi:MAG: hypothetical protein ACJ72R_04170, partial [Nitrososphaeraceae archaeon]
INGFIAKVYLYFHRCLHPRYDRDTLEIKSSINFIVTSGTSVYVTVCLSNGARHYLRIGIQNHITSEKILL